MALFSSPFDTLLGLQQALDAFRTSSWLDAGPSGGGAYPPVNVFRKGEDFVVLAEVPGIRKSDLELQDGEAVSSRWRERWRTRKNLPCARRRSWPPRRRRRSQAASTSPTPTCT